MKYGRFLAALSAFGLAIIRHAEAQEPGALDAYLRTFSALERCVVTYSGKFAATQESPNDIATAAISACSQEGSAFYVAIIGMGRIIGDPDVVMERFKGSLRNSAIETVLEKRYPNVQK